MKNNGGGYDDPMSVSTDELVDYIMGDDAPEKIFHCRKCGQKFQSAKKTPTLCPECRHKAAVESGRIGGKKAKDEEKILRSAQDDSGDEEKILRSAQDDTSTERDDGSAAPDDKLGEADSKGPVALTLGGLRRLLEGQGLDGAEITIDGQPVRSVYVEHYYNLQTGAESYRVDLG